MITKEAFQDCILTAFDPPEKQEQAEVVRVPLFILPTGFSWATLLVISEMLLPDGIDPHREQVSNMHLKFPNMPKAHDWTKTTVDATEWFRYWVACQTGCDPCSRDLTPESPAMKLLTKISDRGKDMLKNFMKTYPDVPALREVWEVPKDCDATFFMFYVCSKTKNPQADQWFFLPEGSNGPSACAWSRYSVILPNPDDADWSAEMAWEIKRMLVIYQDRPTLVLFGWRAVILIGDNFAKGYVIRREGSSTGLELEAIMNEILEDSTVLMVQYSMNSKRLELVMRNSSDAYHNAYIPGDNVYIALQRKQMGMPMENMAVGKILRRFAKYPALFVKECGFSEAVALSVAHLVETRMRKCTDRLKSEVFRGSNEQDALKAYHQYTRFTHWVCYYAEFAKDVLQFDHFVGMLAVLPWKSNFCVSLTLEVAKRELATEWKSKYYEFVDTCFQGLSPVKSGVYNDPELILCAHRLESLPTHAGDFLVRYKETLDLMSAESQVTYGKPPDVKLQDRYTRWLENREYSLAF